MPSPSSSPSAEDLQQERAIKEFIWGSNHRSLLSSSTNDVPIAPLAHRSHASSGSSSRSIEQSGPPTPVPGEPQNFAAVTTGLYRSSFPRPSNYDLLAMLNLRTIITLVAGPYPPEYQTFIEAHGIAHYTIVFPAHKEEDDCIPLEAMRAVQVLLQEEANYPLLVHCNKGKHRTGCAIACYRLLNGWTMEDVLDEYRSFAGVKTRELDERYLRCLDLNPVRPKGTRHAGQRSIVASHLPYPTPPSSDRSLNFNAVD